MKTYMIIQGSKIAHTVLNCHYLKRANFALVDEIAAKRLPRGDKWCDECERLEKKAAKK